MSNLGAFFLKPMDEGLPVDTKSIVVPKGKTTIGRGSYLSCTEKKVSRNHAIIEVTADGELYITPTHVNPCFYHEKGVLDPLVVLAKGEPQKLDPGDQFSLLPESFRYEVVVVKSQENGDVVKAVKIEDTSDTLKTTVVAKHNSPKTKHEKGVKKEPDLTTSVKNEVLSQDEMSDREPSQRTLPGWMAAVDDGDSATEKTGAKKKTSKPPKNTEKDKQNDYADFFPISSDEDDDKSDTASSKPDKQEKQKSRIATKHEISEDDDDSAEESKAVKREKKISPIATRHDMSDDDDDSAEEPIPKKREKKKSPTASRHAMSEDDDDDSAVESKPIKREKKISPIVSRHAMSEDDDDSAEESKPKIREKKKSPIASKHAMSDDDEGSAEESKSEKPSTANKRKDPTSDDGPKSKKRKPCEFGKKCYRKNPVHFKECSHPGDDDYTSDVEEDNEDKSDASEDDDRPECEFGTDCYRKNVKHRKEYKHTKRPTRKAAREAKRKTANHEDYSDDDSFEGSFIDDSNDDSSYSPDDEDLRTLRKEAKEFTSNKKLYEMKS